MAPSASDAAIDDLAHLLLRFSSLRRAAAWDEAAELPDLHAAAATIARLQPTGAAARPREPAALTALVTWATERGAELCPALRLVSDARGVRFEATRELDAGAELLRVPQALARRASQIQSEPTALGRFLASKPLFGPGALMLWLVCAHARAHATEAAPDAWSPYLASLPDLPPPTALTWPRSPGARLAASSLAQRFLAGVLELYCIVHARLKSTPAAERPLALEAFTLERWLWAGSLLSSRQALLGSELALVPLWDLFDHDDSLGGETSSLEDGALRLFAGRSYAPGEPVRTFYGRRTPSERWVYAGFVTPGPPDGSPAVVPFGLPAEAPLRRDKLVWLLSDPAREIAVRVAPGRLEPARARARWYALDAAELERLGLASVADAWEQELALSPETEARAHGLLRTWLSGLAGSRAAQAPFSAEHQQLLRAAREYYGGLLADLPE